MARFRLQERSDWRWWVTPKLLAKKPIHRWFIFPHSFSSELVHALIAEFGLGPKSKLLDPFCGAGTALVAAKEKGIPATGYDLSPFAVFISRAKLHHPARADAEKAWQSAARALQSEKWNGASREYPDLVKKALPGKLLGAFEAAARSLDQSVSKQAEKDFLKLALLSILPQYSRAVPTGGWLKWGDNRARATSIPHTLDEHIAAMLKDIPEKATHAGQWQAIIADVRRLPDADGTFDAVITSPPYPNRHDYTRVFGVELMFSFLDWKQTRQLRYQSFHSHPEAQPDRPEAKEYRVPAPLTRALASIKAAKGDPRIAEMLRGYFLDMCLALRELHRVTRKSASVALVLGNAQYSGCSILVDEWTALIARKAGFRCDRIVAARYRGNSAQQMGAFGVHPSRESVVILKKL
jgi:hypothetical protein